MGIAIGERVACNGSDLQAATQRRVAIYHDDVVGLARGDFDGGLGSGEKLQRADGKAANGISWRKGSRDLHRREKRACSREGGSVPDVYRCGEEASIDHQCAGLDVGCSTHKGVGVEAELAVACFSEGAWNGEGSSARDA